MKDFSNVKIFFVYILKKKRDIYIYRYLEVIIFRIYNFFLIVFEYRVSFSVDSNLFVVCVNWSGFFFLNGLLKEFVLIDGGQRVYSGFDIIFYILRIADKSQCLIFIFQCVRSFVFQFYRTFNLKVILFIIKMFWFKWFFFVGKLLFRGKKIFFLFVV